MARYPGHMPAETDCCMHCEAALYDCWICFCNSICTRLSCTWHVSCYTHDAGEAKALSIAVSSDAILTGFAEADLKEEALEAQAALQALPASSLLRAGADMAGAGLLRGGHALCRGYPLLGSLQGTCQGGCTLPRHRPQA